jgi:hypothetical protein
MVLLFIFLTVALAIGGWNAWYTSFKNETPFFTSKNMHWLKVWVSVALALTIVIALIARWNSYDNYIELQKFYSATVEQYRGAVEMYEKKAVLNVDRAAWVDFQYQGYQANIASFIIDLRKEVVRYNENLISKKLYKANRLFWPMIHMPDDSDMKIISLSRGGGPLAN